MSAEQVEKVLEVLGRRDLDLSVSVVERTVLGPRQLKFAVCDGGVILFTLRLNVEHITFANVKLIMVEIEVLAREWLHPWLRYFTAETPDFFLKV